MREPRVFQATVETFACCSRVKRFSLIAVNATYAVMIFVSEAGSIF